MNQTCLDTVQGRGTLSAEPIVFLPGWGFSGGVFALYPGQEPWIAPGAPLDMWDALSCLGNFLKSRGAMRVRLVGWSMGAHLALDFAGRFPEKVAALSLLAMRSAWPAEEIEAIRAGLAADPHVFLRDFYRKCFLGYRDAYRRFVAEQQDGLLAALDLSRLGQGLDYLAAWQLPAEGPHCPVTLWQGRKDIIAPPAERAIISGARHRILEHAGHALFLDKEFDALD